MGDIPARFQATITRLERAQEALMEAIDKGEFNRLPSLLSGRSEDIEHLAQHVREEQPLQRWVQGYLVRDSDIADQIQIALQATEKSLLDSRKKRSVHRAYLTEGVARDKPAHSAAAVTTATRSTRNYYQ